VVLRSVDGRAVVDAQVRVGVGEVESSLMPG
jgi:hypothetical protein